MSVAIWYAERAVLFWNVITQKQELHVLSEGVNEGLELWQIIYFILFYEASIC